MKKNVLSLSVLAMVSFVAGCGQQQSSNQGAAPAIEQQAASLQQNIQQAAQTVTETTKDATQQVAEGVKEVTQAVQQQVEQAQAPAADQSEIQAWIAKAKEALANNNFEEAKTSAEQILAKDPNSAEAKSILEQAIAAIQKLAQEKIKEIGGSDLSQTMGNATNKLTDALGK